MEEFDDDFGELYTDVEVQASNSVIKFNGVPDFTRLYTQQQQKPQHSDDVNNDNLSDKPSDESQLREANSGNEGGNGVEVENGSESDDDEDDLYIVVNDDDLDAKNGADKNEEDELVAAKTEWNSVVKDQGLGESVGNGSGEERGNIGENNGCTLQYTYTRRYDTMFMSNQRFMSLRRDDREDDGYNQNGRPSLGRAGPSYAGYVPGLVGSGNNFSLPWYRTILDVDINMFEQKPWMLPGADMTDYFNFGFDEESWKSYCQSLERVRQKTLMQSRNQVNARLRSKLENEAAIEAEVDQGSIPVGQGRVTSQGSDFSMRQFDRQFGHTIHVEDSNTERQPSMVARPPRERDSDVVIEITVQDPEDSSRSGTEDPNDVLDTKHFISGDGCTCEDVRPEIEKLARSKGSEIANYSVEENIYHKSASSDVKRSYESATGSSRMLQDCCSQGKEHYLESDTLHSGKEDDSSGGNARDAEALDALMEDGDRDTTETNPCVAGIDSLVDDHIRSPTPSDSDIRSKASSYSDHYDLRRIHDSRRSLSDSEMEGHLLGRDDHASRQTKRDVTKVKAGESKCNSRARSPIDEDWKHLERRIRRHPEMNIPTDEDDNYHIGIKRRMYGRGDLKACRNGSKPSSELDHKDWLTYREKILSPSFYDKSSSENRLQAACTKDSFQRDHWRLSERDMYFPRPEEFFPKRRIRQRKSEIYEREWYLHERKCMIRDRKPALEDRSAFILHSSVDRESWKQQKVYHDIHLSERIQYDDLSLEDAYSDSTARDRYARSSYPLNGREKYLDSDIMCEKHLHCSAREMAIPAKGDQYLEDPSLDLKYQWDIRDDDRYLNRKTSPSLHIYHEINPVHTERWHESNLWRDDVDASHLFQKRRRHGRPLSPQKGRDGGQRFCNHRDSYDRQDTIKYLDKDNCSRKIQNVVQSKGMDWNKDAMFHRCYSNDYNEDKLGFSEDVSRNKWRENKCGIFRDWMSMHTQNMKHKKRILRNGGGEPLDTISKIPRKVKHEQTGPWVRNSVKLHDALRERKSTGKHSKAGSDTEDDACAADERLKQQNKQQETNESGTKKVMENENLRVEAMRVKKLPIKNHDDASDLEEGQIPTEEKGIVQRTSCNQKLANPMDRLYDENRILETMAKMEKRRERFKEPIPLKKETDPDPKPSVDPIAESKQQRPTRKRRWGGS